MNSQSVNFKFFVEGDSSPFILFGHNKKILYLNNTAEILMGYVTKEELYNLTLSYAPKDFGHKTTRIELKYDLFSFYALSVAYEDEEQIGLRLYHKPRLKSPYYSELGKLPPTDVNILLEANITSFRQNNNSLLYLITDQDLPLCRINQNKFSNLLRKILNTFSVSDKIEISLKLLIGEYLIIQNKKEQLLQLTIQGDKREREEREIKTLAQNINIFLIIKENSVVLQIPFIK